jgi:two-component system, OmpR family, response regulator
MRERLDASTVLIVAGGTNPTLYPDVLSSLNGIRAVLVRDLTDLPGTVARVRPHAVLLDHWPEVSQAVALLRQLRGATEAPILVLAEKAREAERILVLDQGADDVLNKPVSPREVIARLHARLRRYLPLAEGGILRDGAAPDWFVSWRVLSRRRQVITALGEVVPLTAAEFDLLAVLGERPGMPVSRMILAQRVLKRAWSHQDRSIDNLVYQVRRKLAAFDAEALVATLRNQGYSSAIPLIDE